MDYARLGRTGLEVSNICLGCMTYGAPSWRDWVLNEAASRPFLNLVNLGAFIGPVAAHLATNNFTRCFPGMYRIEHLDIQVRCAFTNTIPTAPFRGAMPDRYSDCTGRKRILLTSCSIFPTDI